MTDIDSSILGDLLRDNLANGQRPRLTVTSSSMAPLFRTGDQVILEAIQPEQLQTGDIVTLVDPHSLLTHRIWAIHDKTILTRGDHALVFDTMWPTNAILGRVMGRVHKQRTLSLQTGWGQWLDHYLAALVQQEYRWLTGSQEAPSGVETVVSNTRTKFIHYLFYGWATFITTTVNLATRIKPGDSKNLG